MSIKITNAEKWVCEQIINHMENADLPAWRKPWNGSNAMPHNAINGRRYNGWNMWALMNAPHSDPRYITIKNVGKLGGKLKPEWQQKWDDKEFRGYTVLFWNFPNDKEKAAGKAPFCRAYKVFNMEMVEDIDESKLKPLEEGETCEHDAIDSCEKVVLGYKDIPKVEIEGNRACYTPAFDTIKMPKKEQFPKVEEYYSTLFHELAHSTGHENRLAREGVMNIGMFGDHEYSKEELVAEFTASILCGEAGIAPSTLENSAAYIKGWHKKLKKNPELLAEAIREANKSVRYILDKKFD